jgi:hypothetical protein
MDRTTQLEIFKAQTQNVRELDSTWNHLLRTINRELIKDSFVSANFHTRLLALVFCSWSEATFSKLIHTPYGFELDEIEQIKTTAKNDIVDGWRKCLELGLNHIATKPKSSYIPNIRLSLERIIDSYVSGPRLLRNKIGHGQWCIALNRDNDAINKELTTQIGGLDVVELCIWKEAFRSLSNIIEILIESPNGAFHREYWTEIDKIEEHLRRTEKWTLAEKIQQLKKKASYHKSNA